MKKAIAWITLVCVCLMSVGCAKDKFQEYYDLGMHYISEGEYEEAIIAFTSAIEIDPKSAPAYEGRGDAYAELGEWDNAIADYESALQSNDMDAALRAKLTEAREAAEKNNGTSAISGDVGISQKIMNYDAIDRLMGEHEAYNSVSFESDGNVYCVLENADARKAVETLVRVNSYTGERTELLTVQWQRAAEYGEMDNGAYIGDFTVLNGDVYVGLANLQNTAYVASLIVRIPKSGGQAEVIGGYPEVVPRIVQGVADRLFVLGDIINEDGTIDWLGSDIYRAMLLSKSGAIEKTWDVGFGSYWWENYPGDGQYIYYMDIDRCWYAMDRNGYVRWFADGQEILPLIRTPLADGWLNYTSDTYSQMVPPEPANYARRINVTTGEIQDLNIPIENSKGEKFRAVLLVVGDEMYCLYGEYTNPANIYAGSITDVIYRMDIAGTHAIEVYRNLVWS